MSVLGVTQAAANVAAPLVGGIFAGKQNRRQARLQNKLNKEFLDYQNAYNTPAAQMQRFKDAGLNPALIYGQGSSGNQSSPQQAANYDIPDWAGIMGQAMSNLNQTLLQQSQRQAIDANIINVTAKTATEKLKQQVMAANPLLNTAGFNAVIASLEATAESKQADASMMSQKAKWSKTVLHGGADSLLKSGEGTALGMRKLDYELANLMKRFDLNTQDSQIKNQVLESKEFQNAILEVQKKWLTDADVTPQHIYQFIQMLLMKIL